MKSWISLLLLGPLGGCFVMLDHDLDADDAAEFVATRDDFKGFLSWPHVDVASTPASPPHEASTRTAYLNAPPDEGATVFPVGTMIVKTGAGGEVTGEAGSEVHAMVKRGGGFNDDGARGWEWFEIRIPDTSPSGDDDPILVWRGANPPEGESYGCPPGEVCDEEGLTCNACHEAAVGNDFVNSAAFALDDIDASLLGSGL
jgi:hypothetical protein